MNYRHSYHAGNFADVLKHAVLARLIDYLKRKDKAFRVIDTHAGSGLYDLQSDAALRTGEWVDGIGRLRKAKLSDSAKTLLAPYLAAVEAANAEGNLRFYPGSPSVARHLLRKQDRLSLVELHPEEATRLRSLFEGDYQARVIELDGWLALGAHLPPKEKRGLVLIDPPFEQEGEFDRMVDGLTRAHARWAGGIYALWYPIKDRKAVAGFRDRLVAAGLPRTLDIWQTIQGAAAEPRLDGAGLVVVNPPFTLSDEMATLLPELTRILGKNAGADWSIDWLVGEQAGA